MSGIVGSVGPIGSPADWEWVQDATWSMTFRGPDGSNTWHDGHAALGHAHLRTDDGPTPPAQPASIGERLWITGDVRLDGRDDLLRRLGDSPAERIRTADDAELVLRAYDRWGARCLDHISGDFVFAIWDVPHRRLFCARDHFGIGAFYYATAGSRFFFSNTIDCLLGHRDVSADLDDGAIGDFLLFGMNMNRATTTFAQIRRLPPAHSLTWADGRVTLEQYWTPPRETFVRYAKSGDYVERFRELFTQSVSDRLRTNRLSVELSGGLDSTSVAVTAHRLLATAGRPFDLHAHTIVLESLMKDDEAGFARLVAETEGIPIDYLDGAAYAIEDPVRPAAVAPEPTSYRWTGLEYDFFVRASRHGRVALTGQGGDAALMFVPSYWITWLAGGDVRRLSAAVWHHVRLCHRLPPAYLRPAVRHLLQMRRASADVPSWIDEGFVRRTELSSRGGQVAREALEQIDARGMGTAPFWGNVFNRFDPGFTRLPVRYRHPFFDLRLVTYLLALPPAPWLPRKQLLRDAMRPLLPAAIVERRKTPLVQSLTRAQVQRGLDPAAMMPLAAAPDLDRYIVRDRLAAQLSGLPGADAVTERSLVASLGLAHWLFHRRQRQALWTGAGREHPSPQPRLAFN